MKCYKRLSLPIAHGHIKGKNMCEIESFQHEKIDYRHIPRGKKGDS